MDLRKLKTLIDLVAESNISELEITEAEGKVRIVKAAAAVPMALASPAMSAPARPELPYMPALLPLQTGINPRLWPLPNCWRSNIIKISALWLRD